MCTRTINGMTFRAPPCILERSYIVAHTWLMNMLLLQTGIFCRIFVLDICECVPESALFLRLYKNKLYVFATHNKILKDIYRHLSLLTKNTRTIAEAVWRFSLPPRTSSDQQFLLWTWTGEFHLTLKRRNMSFTKRVKYRYLGVNIWWKDFLENRSQRLENIYSNFLTIKNWSIKC